MTAAASRRCIALALFFMFIAVPLSAEESGVCTPFGNQPAQVQRGIIASWLAEHSPICIGGTVLGPWTDSDETARFACHYEPSHASPSSPLPLVVFIHPSLTSADSIHLTNLLDFMYWANLGSSGRGFIVLAPQGRSTTHFYPPPDDTGLGWDNWYRQLNPAGDVTVGGTTYKENVDAAAIDHFVAQEVASGKVDRKRIYVVGWSNGGAMAILYALNRPNIAAAAIFSGVNPFAAFNDTCTQRPVTATPANDAELRIFNPALPVLHIHNACDVVGLCANAMFLNEQLSRIGPGLDDIIVDGFRREVSECDSRCGADPLGDPSNASSILRGFANHARWPFSWTATMLDFLRRHPPASH